MLSTSNPFNESANIFSPAKQLLLLRRPKSRRRKPYSQSKATHNSYLEADQASQGEHPSVPLEAETPFQTLQQAIHLPHL